MPDNCCVPMCCKTGYRVDGDGRKVIYHSLPIKDCVVPENIHTPPPPRKAFCFAPPSPPGISVPEGLWGPPHPPGISNIFNHPFENSKLLRTLKRRAIVTI